MKIRKFKLNFEPIQVEKIRGHVEFIAIRKVGRDCFFFFDLTNDEAGNEANSIVNVQCIYENEENQNPEGEFALEAKRFCKRLKLYYKIENSYKAKTNEII